MVGNVRLQYEPCCCRPRLGDQVQRHGPQPSSTRLRHADYEQRSLIGYGSGAHEVEGDDGSLPSRALSGAAASRPRATLAAPGRYASGRRHAIRGQFGGSAALGERLDRRAIRRAPRARGVGQPLARSIIHAQNFQPGRGVILHAARRPPRDQNENETRSLSFHHETVLRPALGRLHRVV